MAEEKKVNYLPEDGKEEFLIFLNRQAKEHPVVKTKHGKWKELIEWENGNQYAEWLDETQAVAPVPLRKRKKKIVVNLMKPLGEAIEGKINFTYQLAGVPNSSEMVDIASAKVATKLLAHNDYVNNVEYMFEEMKYDLIRTGNAFIGWVWDTGKTGLIKRQKEDGSLENVEQEGDVMVHVPSVFNVRPDPTAKGRDDMRWIIILSEVTEDELLAKFKVTKDDLRNKGGSASSEDEKYRGMNENVSEKDKDERTYILMHYWERKSGQYPKGRLIIALPHLVLYKGENPCLGEIPYWHFGFKRWGNSIWHTGPFHHVQDIQREFNRCVSMISEHIEGWRAKIVIDQGSNLKQGAFTTDSFEILELDLSKGDPRPVSMPELSPQVSAYRDFLAGSVDKVSNVHEVSYSQLPQYASRAPASLYSMMLEQENLKIDPMLKKINKNIVEMGSFRLRLMDKYYKQPRLVKVVGKSEETSVEYFKGADLNSNFDVKLVIGVSLHQSRTIQQRLILELKTQGIITDNNKILKLLDMGDISEELRGDLADESRAMRENQSFINDTYDKEKSKGGVFVYLHDNHALHLDYHTNLAKTEEAQRWSEEKWQALDAHINEHFVYQQAMSQLGAQPGGAMEGEGAEAVSGMPGGEESLEEAPTEVPPGPAEGGVTPEVAATREMTTI